MGRPHVRRVGARRLEVREGLKRAELLGLWSLGLTLFGLFFALFGPVSQVAASFGFCADAVRGFFIHDPAPPPPPPIPLPKLDMLGTDLGKTNIVVRALTPTERDKWRICNRTHSCIYIRNVGRNARISGVEPDDIVVSVYPQPTCSEGTMARDANLYWLLRVVAGQPVGLSP